MNETVDVRDLNVAERRAIKAELVPQYSGRDPLAVKEGIAIRRGNQRLIAVILCGATNMKRAFLVGDDKDFAFEMVMSLG